MKTRGNEPAAKRLVSKTGNPGSNPGSLANLRQRTVITGNHNLTQLSLERVVKGYFLNQFSVAIS